MTIGRALVVGGGLIGAACAWRLLRDGWTVDLVDPGDARAASSWGNAGHLAIEQTAPLASIATLRSLPRRLFAFGGPVGLHLRDAAAWLPFGLRLLTAARPARFTHGRNALKSLLAHALPAWRRIAEDIGAPALIRADGHFVAWESEVTHARGRGAWLAADLGTAAAHDATDEELRLLRSLFAGRPVRAMRFIGSGHVIDIPALLAALASALRTAGVTIRRGCAGGIELDGGKASLRLEDGSRHACDLLVVAAGVGSAPLLRPFERSVPLIAERGYHVETDGALDGWPVDLPPVVFEDRSVIVTRFASTLRIAGFTEFAAATAPADAQKWDRLDRHADALGLPGAGRRMRWIGARPTLPDYLPAIGRSLAASNLVYAFGHQHLGVTLAAITGELVADLVRGSEPVVPLAPFDLRRFA